MKNLLFIKLRWLTAVIITIYSCGWPATGFSVQINTIGDSITQGLQRTKDNFIYGIPYPLNGAANIGGYQPRLKVKIDAAIGSSNLYNWGIGGERSTGGVGRIGFVLSLRRSEYILIMYGANDLYAGISSSTTQANVGSMIDQSRARNVIPIISEITPNTYASGGQFDALIANDYNPKLKSLAAFKKTRIVLMYYEMRSGWEFFYNSGDGLHLSDTGYDKMSQEWFEVFEQVYRLNNRSNIMPVLIPLLLN